MTNDTTLTLIVVLAAFLFASIYMAFYFYRLSKERKKTVRWLYYENDRLIKYSQDNIVKLRGQETLNEIQANIIEKYQANEVDVVSPEYMTGYVL